jgi:CRP-like cAMP-binding protein
MKNSLFKNLQSVRFFNGLNDEQLEQVCNKSRLLSYKKDDIIFCQGDEANAFFIITEGWVTIAKENKDAEQSILHVFKEGDSFAEPAAIVIGRYPATAYAATACNLLEINTSALKKMIQEDPDIAMRMIARLSSQLNTLVNEFEQYKTMSVPKRLAIFLLDLMEQSPHMDYVDLPFNKTVLSTYLGIQPGTLSRAFNQLAEYGVKSNRSGHILFEDIKVLQTYINSSE